MRPLFLGPISIAIFTLSFVVALPLTTVSFEDHTRDMVLVMTPGLIGGLVVAYPAVACRLIETQTDFCWIFFRLDGNPNQKYHSWSFSFPSPHLVN